MNKTARTLALFVAFAAEACSPSKNTTTTQPCVNHLKEEAIVVYEPIFTANGKPMLVGYDTLYLVPRYAGNLGAKPLIVGYDTLAVRPQ